MTNRKKLNHSQSPEKAFNTTSYEHHHYSDNKQQQHNDKSRLPAVNITTYYKSGGQNNNSQSTTMLHFPLQKKFIEENAQLLPFRTKKRFSILDQMSDQIFNLRFTSFMQIGEENQNLVNTKEEVPIPYIDPTKTSSKNSKSVSKLIGTDQKIINTEESLNNSEDIDMELLHNKMVFKHLSEYQKNDYEVQLRQLKDSISKNQKEQKMQLHIRSFPTINKVKNKVGQLHQFSQLEQMGSQKTITKSRKNSSKGTRQEGSHNNSHHFGTPMGFWYKQEENTNYKPEFREMASSSFLGKKAFLYGGIGMHVLNDLVEIDLVSFQSKKLLQTGDKPQNRYAGALHTLSYPIQILHTYSAVKQIQVVQPPQRNLILFAGESSFNSQMKQRECLCDCRVYNIDTGDWKYLRPNSDFMPEARRSFGSCVIGKGLLIHGGQTNRSNYLKDIYYLNLTQCKWMQVDATNELYPDGLAFHQMLPIYNRPQSVMIGSMHQEKSQNSIIKKFKIEGIYSFGGCYQDKNKLAMFDIPFVSILLLHQSFPAWMVPETLGLSPQPRTLHSVSYILQYNSVAIYGGRNDLAQKPYMCDMHLLQLDTLQWVQVRQVGDVSKPRGGHCTFNYGTQILVIGGLNLQGYLSSQLEKCELDRGVARQLFDQYQMKAKFNPGMIQQTTINEVSPEEKKVKTNMRNSIFYNDQEQLQKLKDEQIQYRIDQKNQIELLKYSNFIHYLPVVKEKIVSKYESLKSLRKNNGVSMNSQQI